MFPIGRGVGRTLAPFLNLVSDMYLHHLISSGDDQNVADDINEGARGTHFLKFETRFRNVAPIFAIVIWGRRCRVCPKLWHFVTGTFRMDNDVIEDFMLSKSARAKIGKE